MDSKDSEEKLVLLMRTALTYTDKVFGAHWDEIQKIPVFTVSEAVALSIDLDPLFADVGFVIAVLMYARDEPLFDDFILTTGFSVLAKRMKNKMELLETFRSRYVEAIGNIEPKGKLPFFEKTDNPQDYKVRLTDFATWAKGRGWSLPAKFPCTQNIVLAKPVANDEKIHIQEILDRDIAKLFDPVTVTALEKMFPSNKWENWANHAASNGLKKARAGRGKYNPYKAAMWFSGKNIKGWDLARINRTLANNLPHRSKHEKDLFVSDLE